MVTPDLPATLMGGLAQLPARNRLGLGLGLAALAAVLVASWLWSRAPEWRVLYSNLSDRDGGAIVAQLAQMGVPYKFTEGGGALVVPAGAVHDTRLRLATQGLPKGSIVGFELLENQKLGATQFQEQVNFQRGLEGELARTIQSLAAVQSARVHLAIPKPTVFMRERQKPSGSVMLALHPGRSLDAAQVSGIVHLVASSVPELTPRAVTVVDQSGALISAAGDGGAGGMDATQLSYLREIENGYIRRILDIVEPVVGRNNVRAQVAVEVDFTQSESTAEIFKPNQNPKEVVLRSQASSVTSETGATMPAGIPGTASNQPGASTSARAQSGGTPSKASKRDSTVSYEVDKTVRVVRHASGVVKRVSAAVVVNYRKDAGKKGKGVLAPLKEDELASLTGLVREAIGFSKERGDSLSLANTPFSIEEIEIAPELPLWKRPETVAYAFDIGKHLLAAAIVLALGFGLLRPLLAALAVAPPALPAPSAAAMRELGNGRTGEGIAAARALASQDPKIVANVVKGWVSKDG
jgi:flagellar M-ring protein FliF